MRAWVRASGRRAWTGAVAASFENLGDAEDAGEAALGVPLLEVYSPELVSAQREDAVAVAPDQLVEGQPVTVLRCLDQASGLVVLAHRRAGRGRWRWRVGDRGDAAKARGMTYLVEQW